MYVVAALDMAFYVHDYELNDMKDVQGIHLCQSAVLWICIVIIREKDQQRTYLAYCTLSILDQSTHLAYF